MIKKFEQTISILPNGIWSSFKYECILGGGKKSKFLAFLKHKNVFILKDDESFAELEKYRTSDGYDWLSFSFQYRAICFDFNLDMFGFDCTKLCTFEYKQEIPRKRKIKI